MSVENDVKKEMRESLEHYKEDLKNIRTSRANPSMLDSVFVEVYGSKMRIRDLANITVPESRQLLITPYDSSNTNAIAKAIDAANLNVQPVADGKVVRINTPQMDESIRKDMVKKCKERAENAKIRIREVRRKYNEILKKQKQSGEIPEDISKKEEKLVQEQTDRFCKDIDCICTEKEKEVLEV
ncbi:MAG: Ribosome-recycling factor [Candidatus Anoxychlamydiales bacterium]|nr:Ribosome-recycling factor [Candidatus Anoxychlamydiales bacterium]